MTDTTHPQERDMDDPEVIEDVARYCDACAESSARHMFTKRAASFGNLATRLRTQPSPREVALEKALQKIATYFSEEGKIATAALASSAGEKYDMG